MSKFTTAFTVRVGRFMFGMIAVWVSIAYFVAKRYHRKAPGNLQYEIDQHLYGDIDYDETF